MLGLNSRRGGLILPTYDRFHHIGTELQLLWLVGTSYIQPENIIQTQFEAVSHTI